MREEELLKKNKMYTNETSINENMYDEEIIGGIRW